MSCSFGEKIKITVFGQSHSDAIGVCIDGIPAGEKIDLDKVYSFMKRRAPGKNKFSTPRKESDIPHVLSGLVDNVTCGTPICAVIENNNTHSKDYDSLKYIPRPGHSDFAAYMKTKGFNDIRGGGNFSGRMTAPVCFAGAVIMQILERKGIEIGAHIYKTAGIEDEKINTVNGDMLLLKSAENKEFPVLNDEKGREMQERIEEARLDSDSVGGIIECVVTGVAPGFGDPIYDGVENKISSAIFGIPAVKGIEFGAGFLSADLKGSENNDSFYFDGDTVKTRTNNHGGILGGITSGMPIVFRAAVKPTPSISKLQESVNLSTKQPENLVVGGRHDPCIVPRAVPVVQAVTAAVIYDLIQNN